MKTIIRALLEGPKKKQPKVVSAWTGWFGILNKYGHLSEIKPNRYAAQHAVEMRGDGHECRIEPVIVTLDGRGKVKEYLQPKERKKAKRR